MRTDVRALLAAVLTVVCLDAARGGDDLQRIDSVKLSVDFRGVTLDDAIDFLRQTTGLNFVVQEGGVRRVRITLREVSARTILELMLKPMGLCASWRDGVVVIGPRDRGETRFEIRMYDVRSALLKLRDWPGPKVELIAHPVRGGGLLGFA